MLKSIIAPAVLVSLLWIVISIFSTFTLNSLVQSNDRILAKDVATIGSAWAMRRHTWKMQTATLSIPRVDSQEVRQQIESLEAEFRRSLRDAHNTSLTPPEQAAIRLVDVRFDSYAKRIYEMLDARATDWSDLSREEWTAVATLATELSDACRQLSEINEDLITRALEENQKLYRIVTWMRSSAIIVGPAAGLLVGLWLSRRLRKSVSQISEKLHRAGDALTDHAEANSLPSGELNELGLQADIIASRVKEVRDELERTRQQAIQSERLAAVGELASGLAHEIRNPLTSIKLLIQNAAQSHASRGFNERQSEVLLQEISRIEVLVEDLLNFARPPRMRVVRHDVRQTVQRALNLVDGRARQRAVHITGDFPAGEVMLTGDAEQLLLVFLNLAINALEATTKGGITVTLRETERSCRFEFRDSGRGITPGVFNRMFEPFVTTKERGTGLGLAICRRIVHQHGGVISAENLPGGGAMFTVDLPAGPASAEGGSIDAVDRGLRNEALPSSMPLPAILIPE